MKKILIINNKMNTGGIQRSLANLVKELHRDYDITLLLFSKSGSLLREIPEDVKILTPIEAYRILGLEKNELKKYPILFLLKAFFLAYARIFSRRSAMKLLGLGQKVISGYDTVISYSHFPHPKYFGNGCGDFVLDKTKCENKVCFIHCDYLNFGGKTEKTNRTYREFDKIACCSDSVRERFLIGSGLPENKVYTVRNFYDLSLLDYRPDAVELFDDSYINLVIMARLSEEKGILRAIEALHESKRTDIRYYIVGDGPQKEQILHTIKYYHMDRSVNLLGEQREPEKYLSRADWLLVPSFHEAAPMVFDEAMLLGIPVITTKTTSAEEMIGNTCGIVCDNSTAGIVDTLLTLQKPVKTVDREFDNHMQKMQLAKLL